LLDALRPAVAVLEAAWHYRSRDNYRTETYTETYTDSEGKTRTRTNTRQVYDDTDHYFTFDRAAATRSCDHIESVLKFKTEAMYRPGLDGYEVEPASPDAAAGSPYRASPHAPSQGSLSETQYVRDTILEDRKADVSDEVLRGYLNAWLQSAHLPGALARTHSGVDCLRRAAPQSKPEMMASGPSYHYKTTSRSHSGPAGYRAAEVMLQHCRAAFESLGAGLGSISQCCAAGAQLARLGRGEIPDGWATGSEAPEAEELAKQTLDTAIECYLSLFPGSTINMDQRVRTSKTVWTAIVCAILGGLAGILIHPQTGLLPW
jgi:hypothetical protein